jgi:hypothetical protein
MLLIMFLILVTSIHTSLPWSSTIVHSVKAYPVSVTLAIWPGVVPFHVERVGAHENVCRGSGRSMDTRRQLNASLNPFSVHHHHRKVW